jgi:hypothetical protein
MINFSHRASFFIETSEVSPYLFVFEKNFLFLDSPTQLTSDLSSFQPQPSPFSMPSLARPQLSPTPSPMLQARCAAVSR